MLLGPDVLELGEEGYTLRLLEYDRWVLYRVLSRLIIRKVPLYARTLFEVRRKDYDALEVR